MAVARETLIDPARLEQLPNIRLLTGSHEAPTNGIQACAMELVSWIANEPWGDHPECACPVISTFMRAWNDALADDERTALLLPLIPELVGTRGSKALEERRALMAADWLVRVNTPAWLRLAGFAVHADALTALPEITSFKQISSIRRPIEAARLDAAAAWAAAWDELAPVKAELQQLALALVRRMIAATDGEAAHA